MTLTMFTAIKRKAAAILHKKRRSHSTYVSRAKDQEHTDNRIVSPRSKNNKFGIAERGYPSNLKSIANRTYRAGHEEDQISILDLNDGRTQSSSGRSSVANPVRSVPPSTYQQQQQSDTDPQGSASVETEIVGPVTVRCEGRYYQALLLTADIYGWIQDIARIRRELCNLDVNIAELTGQAANLRVAKETLGSQEENIVPGAFPNAGDDGETARRHLLVPAIRRRLDICEGSLHDLDGRRQVMATELDVPQQKILGVLGQIACVVG